MNEINPVVLLASTKRVWQWVKIPRELPKNPLKTEKRVLEVTVGSKRYQMVEAEKGIAWDILEGNIVTLIYK